MINTEDFILEIKSKMSDDIYEYAEQVYIIANHFVNQLIDITTDAYALGIKDNVKKEMYQRLNSIVKNILSEVK